MNHADVRARMADYLEGHLALTDRALLDAHLDGCNECAREIAEIRATIAVLRGLPEPRVPGDFTANVMRRIRAGEAEPGWLERLASFSRDLGLSRALAPASAVALSVGLALWAQQAGVISMGRPQDADRLAQQTAAAIPRADAQSNRGSTPTANTDAMQLAGMVPTRNGDPAGSDARNQIGEHRAGGAAPSVGFQIVLLDGHRPPYVLEAGGHGVVAPMPWQIQQPATPSPKGFEGGGSLSVASSESAIFDGLMRPPGPSIMDPVYGTQTESSGGEPRSRSDWLAILEANPADFSARLSSLTLAEQEIWIDRLARHAASEGTLDRVVSRLEDAGGPRGRALAASFTAAGAEAASSMAVDPAR